MTILAYASRTGTKRNLAALREAGWRLMLSPTGVLRDEGFAYALDNGAWTVFNKNLIASKYVLDWTGLPAMRPNVWDEAAFVDALERFGRAADFVVAPDIVKGGPDSLRLSVSWLARCLHHSSRVLIAVQDGMRPADVASILCKQVGIFVGGSDEWKEQSTAVWAELADVRGAYIHVGRVNSQRRLRICQMAGVDSFDGSGPSRFEKHLRQMERGLAQPCFRVAPKAERMKPGPKPRFKLRHVDTGLTTTVVQWGRILGDRLGIPPRVAYKRLCSAFARPRSGPYLGLVRASVSP